MTAADPPIYRSPTAEHPGNQPRAPAKPAMRASLKQGLLAKGSGRVVWIHSGQICLGSGRRYRDP